MTEFILQHPFWIAAVFLVLTAACTAHYKLHPGALNTTDSAAYDTLLIAEAAIDQARSENQTRPFSAEAKDALNILIQSYNVTRAAWLTYRGAVATSIPSDSYFQQLNRNLSDLVNAIEALKKER
jgi:hypothetical protein